MRHAYEQLAAEHRRAQAAIAQLEREAAGREGALRSRVEEVAALQEAQRAAQATINQYIVDMQVGPLLSGQSTPASGLPPCVMACWHLAM